jgi:hypothetical protein
MPPRRNSALFITQRDGPKFGRGWVRRALLIEPSYNRVMRWFCTDMRTGARASIRWGVVLCLLCGVSFATKEFVKPEAKPARSYMAHDDHTDEKVAVGVDPYDTPEKAQIFTVKWAEEGYLPVFVVITNDGDQPVSLASLQVQFITEHRDKISAATDDDLYRRLSHIKTGRVYPLPIPQKQKGAVGKKALDEIDRAQFSAKAVEPHSTQSGFVFFDISGISSPMPGARVYLTGVRDAKGAELLYFEIPLQK